MKRITKAKKILLIAICVSLVLILSITMLTLYFTVGQNFNKYDQPTIDYSLFNENAVLSQIQVNQDRSELIKNVESTHPYFVIKTMDGYNAAKQKFQSTDIKTSGDFYFAAAEYLAFFEDLHTSAISAFPDFLILDITSYADNNKWMVYPYGEGNGAYEVTRINGVPLIDIIGKYTSMENENSVANCFVRLRINAFLKRAGINWDDSLTFTYKNIDGTTFDVDHNIIENSTGSSNETLKNFEAEIKNGDILYIYAREMSNDGNYQDCINYINNAISNGLRKLL